MASGFFSATSSMSVPPCVEKRTSGLRLVTSTRTAAYHSRWIGQRSSTRTRSTRLPPIVMPSISRAIAAPSAGVSAILMPPDFPRFPVGTWALITEGPIFATAADASSALLQTVPLGIGTPAGARTFCLAAYSSRFIAMVLSSVPGPMRTKKLFFGRLVFGDGNHEMGNVEEVLVVQV